MGKVAQRDLLFSLAFGIVCLLFFHLDHLVASYSGWDDPNWWLHLIVDSGYVLVYGTLGWLGRRGWRVWQRANNPHRDD